MQRLVTFILATVFVLALAAYMMTYTVKFTETAVLTTFGQADPQTSVKSQPGLGFKWPFPIQSVTTYDKRLRFVEAKSETQQTADSRQIIVQSFATWRVKDPLKFFQRFSTAGVRADDHYNRAAETLKASLRSAMGATSRFRMDELFNASSGQSKLPELEKAIASAIRTAADAQGQQTGLDEFGIELADVGVSRILLPGDTTQKVFERMGANRDRLAAELQSQGESTAQAIRSKARADAEKIESFAKARAADIRSVGDIEANEFVAQMNANPELAVFLRNMEFMRDALSKRTTLVLPTSAPGMGLFRPDALERAGAGKIPPFAAPAEKKAEGAK